MLVQILVDNPHSWIIPYAKELVNAINLRYKHQATLINNENEVVEGDILCLLSCEKIFKKLKLNNFNLVVHESNLPEGKGWSPLTWQVLEGKTKIPVTLFEATKKVDSGQIYLQEFINLNGDELLIDIKHQQGKITIKLILDFLKKFTNITGKPQIGIESFYGKRTYIDSQLDIDKTIKDQFNLLRVCDNERYPAFFIYKNKKYLLKIENSDKND